MTLPPGPRFPFSITYQFMKDPFATLSECFHKYGDIFTLHILTQGKNVLIADPEVVKDIFTIHSGKLDTGSTVAFLKPYLGENSLFVLDGAEYARQRRMVTPAFNKDRIKIFDHMMCDYVHKRIDSWQPGQLLSVHAEMSKIMLGIIVRTIFAERTNQDHLEIAEAIKKFLIFPTVPIIVPLLRINLGDYNLWGKFLSGLKKLNTIIYKDIADRRKKTNIEPKDVIDVLMLSKDEDGKEMTDQQIRDHCLTSVLASYGTTVQSLNWAFASILQNKEVVEKILEELKQVLGDEQISGEMLPRLPYLDAVVKESLRMNNFFLVPLPMRQTTESLKLKNYTLPSGTNIIPCTPLIHYLPTLYRNADQFQPERFLDNENKITPYNWIPFGGKPRQCVGMAFAQAEMKIILATILRRVDLELVSPKKLEPPKNAIALPPPKNVKVKVVSIKPLSN